MDDFGAGHSNLDVIAALGPKMVKLDRKLVEDLDRKPFGQKVVASVVRLCRDLGDELTAVRDCGVQYGQGYLLGRPSFPAPPITWPPAAPSDPTSTVRLRRPPS